MNGTRVLLQSRTSMPRPHVEETRPAFPNLVLVPRHICVVLPAVTALPHSLTDARLHVTLVSPGIEKEVSELQVHGRVREGHVVEEGVFRGLGAGREAGFRSISGAALVGVFGKCLTEGRRTRACYRRGG